MMLHRANEQGLPALGLVAWHSTGEKLIVWLLSSQARWALMVESSSSTCGANPSLDLPQTFDPFTWHTIRLRRWGNQLTIYLDGPEVLTEMGFSPSQATPFQRQWLDGCGFSPCLRAC